MTTVPGGPRRTWREGAPSSTPQYNVTALIAVILRYNSSSGDFPGKVRMASIKLSCSGDMSAWTKASRVSSSTTMPENCHSLSFTGCSDLYYSLISLRSSLRFRCFSLNSRLTAFWSLLCFRVPIGALDRLLTRSRNFKIYGRSFTDATYSRVSFRGRRGSIERLIEHTNRIRSL